MSDLDNTDIAKDQLTTDGVGGREYMEFDGEVADEMSVENIRILVRIRPIAMNTEDKLCTIEALDSQTLKASSYDGKKCIQCAYDHVVPPTATQTEVYSIVKSCTDAVLAGYNSTVFAYGKICVV